jgi:hypothetical protein
MSVTIAFGLVRRLKIGSRARGRPRDRRSSALRGRSRPRPFRSPRPSAGRAATGGSGCRTVGATGACRLRSASHMQMTSVIDKIPGEADEEPLS